MKIRTQSTVKIIVNCMITLSLLLTFCLAGCSKNDREFRDGGLAMRDYYFVNYGEYEEFYNIFGEYNQERCIMPKNNDSIEFTYIFSGVAPLYELDTKGYCIDYDFITFSFQVNNLADHFKTQNFGDQKLEFEAVNIENEYDEVFNNLSQISYKVIPEGYHHTINIFIGDIEVAHTLYGKDIFIQDENFTMVMDKIISAFKADKNWVSIAVSIEHKTKPKFVKMKTPVKD